MSVEIKYRTSNGRVASLKADQVTGVVPAGSSTFYWEFYKKDANGAMKHTERVAQVKLLPGYNEKARHLYAKPWRDKIKALTHITLTQYHDADNEIGGIPEDVDAVWMVNYDQHTWVIECKGRAILHVMNNGDTVKKGKDFAECLKKMFPGKPIEVRYPTVTVVKVQ